MIYSRIPYLKPVSRAIQRDATPLYPTSNAVLLAETPNPKTSKSIIPKP